MSTTDTFYADAGGDGFVRRYDAGVSWATLRNAASGDSAGGSSTGDHAVYHDIASPMLYRGFFPFDTSSIPDGATITGATLYLYCTAKTSTGGGSFAVVASTQASNTALATSDYSQVGSTEFSSRVNFSTPTTSAYLSIPLNASGLAAISKTGYTKLALRSAADIDNSAPSGTSNFQTRYSDYASTTYDPYLEVTYEIYVDKTYTADAIIKQEATKTYTADAIVLPDRWADTCTGSDGTNLESHTPTGPHGGAAASGSWSQWYPTAGFARLRITSNKLYSYTSSAIAATSEYRHSQQAVDGQFSADFSIPGAHNDGGYGVLSLRHAGSTPAGGSGYQLYFSNGAYVTAGTLRLDATVAGSASALGNYTIGTLSSAATYTVALVVDGDQISVKLNGVTVLGPFTDTGVTARGYVHAGLASPNGASTSVGVQMDNLLFEPPPEQPTATYTADAIVAAAAATKTYTADGIVLGTSTKTYTADAVITGVRSTKTYTADAIVDGVSYTTSGTRATTGSPLALFPSNGVVGTHGAHYGLPDGITLPDGTKFVVARKSTAHSSPWDGTFVAKTMAPGGSWSAEATILDTVYDERDPSVGLLADGTLCLTWNRLEVNGTYGVGDDDYFYAPFMSCAPGLDPLVAANWSAPVNTTGSGLANNWRVGTDILELTPGGRIVVALYGTPAYPPWTENQCWIAYSDNGGATWGMLSLLDNGNAHALSSSGEAQLALCSDGSVLAVYRTIASPWETWARRSTDSCATWSSEWRVAENSINKTGMVVTPDGDHVIAYGLNATTLAFKQSWDDGATFGSVVNTGYSANLYTQPFAINRVGYSPNVAIAYAYENGAQTLASVYYIELTSTGTPLAQRDTTYTADAIISASGGSAQTKTYTADAIITAPAYSKTYTADAIVKGLGLTKTYTADAALVDSASQSTALSWFFRRRRSSMTAQTKTYTVVQPKGTTKTATWTSPTYLSKSEAGILVVLDVTSASGTGGLTLRINAQDSAGSVSVPLNSAPTTVTAAGTTSYALYPFGAISGALTQSTSGYLPREFSISVTHADSSSYTYSLGYCLLP